jgi:hypothetical protein
VRSLIPRTGLAGLKFIENNEMKKEIEMKANESKPIKMIFFGVLFHL